MPKLVPLIVAGLAACSPGTSPPDAQADAPVEAAPAVCTSTNDCQSVSEQCWFPVNGGCVSIKSQQGLCLPYQAPPSCTPNVACGCDGTSISVCGPAGYVNRASMTSGPCPLSDAGPDVISDGSAD